MSHIAMYIRAIHFPLNITFLVFLKSDKHEYDKNYYYII